MSHDQVRRHHDEGSVSDPKQLKSAPVVDRLIRKFTAWVIKTSDSPHFMPQLEFECRRMNGLFLGESPTDKYLRGPWNAPDQCGEFVQHALQIDGTTRLAVRDAFMVHAAAVIDLMEGSVGREDQAWKADLDALISRLRSALLGIPPDGSR